MKKYLLALAIAAVSFSAVAAAPTPRQVSPYPTFDPNTGMGVVDSSLLPAVDPAGLTFKYQVTTTYSAECTWPNKVKTRYPFTQTAGAEVKAVPYYFAHGIYGGFALSGFGLTFTSGQTIPVLGAICQKGKGGVWTSVDVMRVGDAGLFATYGNQSTPIAY